MDIIKYKFNFSANMELSSLLQRLSNSLKSNITDFYETFDQYILEMVKNKSIKLHKSIKKKDLNTSNEMLRVILDVANSSFNSIGFEGIESNEKVIDKYLSNKKLSDYDDVVSNLIDNYINKNLLTILLEYLINSDDTMLRNLDLFDLLPDGFLDALTAFKQELNLDGKTQSNLNISLRKTGDLIDPYLFKITKSNDVDEDLEILNKIKEAKEDTFKVLKQSNHLENPANQMESIDNIMTLNAVFPDYSFYFDNFGILDKIDVKILGLLKINFSNLIKIRDNFIYEMDLEDLFFFICSMKMLGIDPRLDKHQVKAILNNYINGKVFSTGKYHVSNPISNFYGLVVLIALNIAPESIGIDLVDIEMIMESELNNLIPEKLLLNYFSLLSLNLLKQRGSYMIKKKHLLDKIMELDILSFENPNLPLDILSQLSIIKMIDVNQDLGAFKFKYLSLLNNLVDTKGLVNGNITDTTRTLLIFELLNSSEEQVGMINVLLYSLIENSNLFIDFKEIEMIDWKKNNLYLKLELRMLFWLLFGLYRYQNVLK